jgi:AhpD family alkylhydroperoxidase
MDEGNGFVPLVPVADLPADLREQWEATPRPELRGFIQVMANAPEHFRAFNEANRVVRFENHLGPRVTELVRLALAQTTQCQVCLAGRAPAAVALGMDEDLVAEIGSTSPTRMTPAEQAAVNFALKFGTDHFTITDADKAALHEHFTPEQIVELGLFCALCMVGRFSMLAGLGEQTCAL